MQSFSHAVTFDGGKLRDIDFVAMPRLVDTKLTRDTLAAASSDTLLYLALILNLQQQFATGMTAQDSPLAKAGVKPEDLKAAFGDEMSLLAEWPATARMPSADRHAGGARRRTRQRTSRARSRRARAGKAPRAVMSIISPRRRRAWP